MKNHMMLCLIWTGWNNISNVEKINLPIQRTNALSDNQMYDNNEEWEELSVEDPSCLYTNNDCSKR